MPWIGLPESSNIIFTPAIITLWVLIILGTTASTFVSQAVAGIEQTITPISQERSTIASLRGIICNIPGSIANALPGVLLMCGVFKMDTKAQFSHSLLNKLFSLSAPFAQLPWFSSLFAALKKELLLLTPLREKYVSYKALKRLVQINIFG
ncbi:MAG: hypothetical protein OSJ74_00185 [Clostridia bacterium]|nr:hypothetical protein [Clostridia bacterium]